MYSQGIRSLFDHLGTLQALGLTQVAQFSGCLCASVGGREGLAHLQRPGALPRLGMRSAERM